MTTLYTKIHPRVKIAPTVQFYGDVTKLEIGEGTRIDAFCVISIGSKGIVIGKKVHIGCGVYLYGASGQITIEDYVSLSPRSTLYTATDNMEEDCLIGPTVNLKYRSVTTGNILLQRGSAVGTGGIVFPNVILGRSSILGALSIADRSIPPGRIMVGPSGRLLLKQRNVLKIEEFIKEENKELI